MKLKTFSKLAFALIVIMPFCLSNSSCARRVIAAAPQPVQINVGGATAAPAATSQRPKSRKELRLMKKAQRKGLHY